MGFFSPFSLFFLSLLGPIIWFYLWREKKHVILVSSIIPWRRLSMDQTSDAQTFRIDWQLILQLLVITFATLALARLYWLQTISIKHQVIIIDNSASMSAKDADGKLTRFAAAKSKALDLIAEAKPQTRISLIEMSGNAKRLQDFTDKKSALTKVITELKPKEEATNFQAALNLARSSLRGYMGGSIYLISDGAQGILEDPALKKQITFINVGQNVENLAITGMDSYQGLYVEQERVVYIRVVNFSSKSKSPNLKITLNGELLENKKLDLAPNAYQNCPVKISNANGMLKAELEIDDALPLDNAAYLPLERGDALPVLLITPSDAMEADFSKLAKATGRLTFTRIHPDEFDPKMLGQYRLAIFHHTAPTQFLPIDSLFINAPGGHGLWEIMNKSLENPKIIDWDRRHPTLKYLDFLDKLALEGAQQVQLPAWGNLLIGTSDVPLAFWGEEGGGKQLVFCFDLQPLLFPESQDVSGIILILNSLDWLASSSNKSGIIKTGEPYLLKAAQFIKEAIITNPRGEQVRLTPQQGVAHYDQTDYVGVYTVKTEDLDGKKSEYNFVANLLDEEEAKLIATSEEKTAPQTTTAIEGPQKEPFELWRYVLIISILCLLAEWWLYFKD